MNKSSLPANQKEAIGALLNDHREVQKLFKDFEHTKKPEDKERIAREVCTKLKLHTQLEEELFYPMLREIDPETFGDTVKEAIVEHASAKELISQIEGMAAGDEFFDAEVVVLGEYVNHHIAEEENEILPKVADKKIDLRELGQRMESRRQELAPSRKAA